ncbi:hypothetical protein WSK_3801 [Novosphingobium sp. Rr 2-17]|uniref:hypothetical protein n=1 Tax=Novosphingobium sp. Rr 2-17 TaxID=555793 RepID=UPI00026988F1|nr:hypothetical protein [Novosphingobium sp. Rr 2-17]EIZ77790.1 hypothetical protein WSK_3801 [Novosphingobium sp. Rr 2-17]
MKIDEFLTHDEGLRLECLRLAVAAGDSRLGGMFYEFVDKGTPFPPATQGFISKAAAKESDLPGQVAAMLRRHEERDAKAAFSDE